MATPAIVTDGVTPFDAASMNKFVSGDGTKVQIKVAYATIKYSAGNLVVDSDYDSCGIVTGDLSYNAGTDLLEITLGGFVNSPQIQVTKTVGDTNYFVASDCGSNILAHVEFLDVDTGDKIVGGSPDANMNFNVFIIGY